MNKVFLFILILFTIIISSQQAQAEARAESLSAIQIPKKCFINEDFCSHATIERTTVGRRHINLQFYGQLNNEYDNHYEVIERFLDFKSWSRYTADTQEMNIISSGILSSRTYLGLREITQYARYNIAASWPTNQIEVVERTTYREAIPKGALLIHWNFYTDRDFAQHGIKRKDGSFKVQFIAPLNVYYVKLEMEVVPSTGYLSAARKSIQRAISRLFTGMFNLK